MMNLQSKHIMVIQLFCAFKFGSAQHAIFVETTLWGDTNKTCTLRGWGGRLSQK